MWTAPQADPAADRVIRGMCRFAAHAFGGLIGLILASPTAVQAAVPVAFAPSVPYALGTGTGPSAVAIADFNGDHALDLAVANGSANTVTILPGTGTGSFGAAVALLNAGKSPVAIAAGDLTNDRHPDLIVANMGDGNLSVFVSSGSGFGFLPAITIPLAGSAPMPSALVVGFFTGDGTLDVAVANAGANRVDVLVGDGTGMFSVSDALFFQPHPVGVASADLDHDGKPDLVLARRELAGAGTAAIFLGGPDGDLFHGFGAIGAINDPSGVAAADINGDGIPDLAVTGSTSDRVVVLTGNGDGTFSPPVRFTTGSVPQALAVADFNLDAVADIVTANQGDQSVTVLAGTGTGSLSAPASFTVGAQPQALAVADLDGDGYPDIVAANHGDDSVSVLLNLTGSVTPPPTATPIVAPVIAIGSNAVSAGQSALITVNLVANGASVVATQNDIAFDPTRLTLNPSSCHVNAAIGKALTVNVIALDSTHALLRALVLSFDNLVPIPSGALYSCSFDVPATTSPGSYSLVAQRVIASDATGDSIAGVSATSGAIVVSGPTFTPTATPTPTRSATTTPSPTSSPTGSLPPSPTVTATETSTATASSSPSPTVSATPSPTNSPPACVGDCDHSTTVTVDELVLAVNISLGNIDVAQCRAADADGNGRVSVDELVKAVNDSLNGCPTAATFSVDQTRPVDGSASGS